MCRRRATRHQDDQNRKSQDGHESVEDFALMTQGRMRRDGAIKSSQHLMANECSRRALVQSKKQARTQAANNFCISAISASCAETILAASSFTRADFPSVAAVLLIVTAPW